MPISVIDWTESKRCEHKFKPILVHNSLASSWSTVELYRWFLPYNPLHCSVAQIVIYDVIIAYVNSSWSIEKNCAQKAIVVAKKAPDSLVGVFANKPDPNLTGHCGHQCANRIMFQKWSWYNVWVQRAGMVLVRRNAASLARSAPNKVRSFKDRFSMK